jgi:hypothetical protein
MDACVSVISFSSFSFFKKKQENYDLSAYRGQSLLLRIAGRNVGGEAFTIEHIPLA